MAHNDFTEAYKKERTRTENSLTACNKGNTKKGVTRLKKLALKNVVWF